MLAWNQVLEKVLENGSKLTLYKMTHFNFFLFFFVYKQSKAKQSLTMTTTSTLDTTNVSVAGNEQEIPVIGMESSDIYFYIFYITIYYNVYSIPSV